jgi:uncharacterized repeat protein (TIGR01451 family)
MPVYKTWIQSNLFISLVRTKPLVWLVLLLAVGFGPVCVSHLSNAVTAEAEKTARPPLARWDQDGAIHAQAQGNPRSDLFDLREALTDYEGPAELVELLRQNQAQPLAMTTADFDEDGVPDLVVGYAGASSGAISFLRGNVDAIYPNSPEAQARKAAGTFTDAPFLSPARVFVAPIAPDFIGAGDFDADGRWDVVVASRNDDKLYLLAGDGRGGLNLSGAINLPGRVTALTVGEINRRDGLDDVIVGVTGQVLVFEGPRGALRAQPETFYVRGAPAALALGNLDDDRLFGDLAIAAGRQLRIVYGRDRRLSSDESLHAIVQPAAVERLTLPDTAQAMQAGNFISLQRRRDDLAFLSEDGELFLMVSSGRTTQKRTLGVWPQASGMTRARISGKRRDDLVVLDKAARRLQLVSFDEDEGASSVRTLDDPIDEPLAALTMRLNSDALTDLVILRGGQSAPLTVTTKPVAVITVNSVADTNLRDDVITLREAILLANGELRKDALTAAEQALAQMTPAASQPDAIQFNIPGGGVKTISLTSNLPTIKDTVAIDGTTQTAAGAAYPIQLENGGLLLFFDTLGVTRSFANDCLLRGLELVSPTASLSFSQLDHGIAEGNKVSGAISVALANFIVVGGRAAAARNLAQFISVFGFEAIVQGNSATGISVTGETGSNSQGNLIGGAQARAGNDVSGLGIKLFDYSRSSIVQGNTINGKNGMELFDTRSNLVGGTSPAARNVVIGADARAGIVVGGDSHENLIQGNLIGVDAQGNKQGGFTTGVSVIEAKGRTVVGGAVAGAGNVISGSEGDGVVIADSRDSVVQGNFIGTDATGTRCIPNQGNGVVSTAANTLVKDNTISGNGQHGVAIGLPRAPFSGNLISGGTGTIVVNNRIGTDITGAIDLGNKLNGVFVDNNSVEHTIRGNVIAFNKKGGVFIPNQGSEGPRGLPGFDITVLSNSIFANGGVGIALEVENGSARVTRGAQTSANRGQNIPILDSITTDESGQTVVTGRLLQPPDKGFRIELYSSAPSITNAAGLQAQPGVSCKREGETPMGIVAVPSTQVKPDGSFSIVYAKAVGSGYINATATSGVSGIGDTSEFSVCQPLSDLKVTNEITTTGLILAGQTLNYKVTVENLGIVPAQTVKLNMAVPKFTTFQSSGLLPGGAGQWTAQLPSVGSAQGEISYSAESLLAGASASFEIAVRIVNGNPDVGPGAEISGTATVSSGTLDFNPQNDAQSKTIKLGVPPADLAVTLERLPGEVFTGDDLSLRASVINNGPYTANAVRLELSESAPRNTVFRSGTDLGGWRREVDNSGTVSFSTATLTSGSAAQFTIIVRVVKAATITFTATVTSETPEPDEERRVNNKREVSINVSDPPPGPLLVEITVAPDSITAVGLGFADGVRVFVDDVPFESATTVEDGRKVIQRGRLVNGKNIAEAIPPGQTVFIKFRNPDGGRVVAPFRN